MFSSHVPRKQYFITWLKKLKTRMGYQLLSFELRFLVPHLTLFYLFIRSSFNFSLWLIDSQITFSFFAILTRGSEPQV